jgi:hypothetical protein
LRRSKRLARTSTDRVWVSRSDGPPSAWPSAGAQLRDERDGGVAMLRHCALSRALGVTRARSRCTRFTGSLGPLGKRMDPGYVRASRFDRRWYQGRALPEQSGRDRFKARGHHQEQVPPILFFFGRRHFGTSSESSPRLHPRCWVTPNNSTNPSARRAARGYAER